MKTIILSIILLAPPGAHAQGPHTVAPRTQHVANINDTLRYITDTVSLERSFYFTLREQDSICILDFRDLLAMDHTWLSHNVWRNDSADGIYRRNRIARNEINLQKADSAFTVQYGNRFTSK
jgi:hypothetical protein